MRSIPDANSFPISSIRQLATDILRNCTDIEGLCHSESIPQPSLSVGSDSRFWSENSCPELVEIRNKTLGQLENLAMLLQGPHDFLHEFTASNWDQGALYVFLQHRLLDFIAAAPGGCASLSSLSKQSSIPEDKLVRILGLLKCRQIIEEAQAGSFALTAISEKLVHDRHFAQWVGFQLFETRVASAHLADALANKPNDYKDGTSGFKQGFGVEMYEWHVLHPEKGERFRQAMKGVSTSLDPADHLIRKWFDAHDIILGASAKVVELGGRYGFASISLVEDKPGFLFEVRCETEDFLRRGAALVRSDCHDRISFSHVDSLAAPVAGEDAKTVSVYLIRNLLWNWQDDEVVDLLQTLVSALRVGREACIIITDGVSPQSGDYTPHVEIGYRRRDVTTMTMHNAKQRSQAEWLAVFRRVDPSLQICTTFAHSSHVDKGLWELRLEA